MKKVSNRIKFECPDPPFNEEKRKKIKNLLKGKCNINTKTLNNYRNGKPYHATVFDLKTNLSPDEIKSILKNGLGTYFNKIKF